MACQDAPRKGRKHEDMKEQNRQKMLLQSAGSVQNMQAKEYTGWQDAATCSYMESM